MSRITPDEIEQCLQDGALVEILEHAETVPTEVGFYRDRDGSVRWTSDPVQRCAERRCKSPPVGALVDGWIPAHKRRAVEDWLTDCLDLDRGVAEQLVEPYLAESEY